jgi:Icc-related predicted phosphoesterase
MKIALASDIHLEFGDINLKNEENAEVLILSGDICTAKVFKQGGYPRKTVVEFFSRVAFQFPHVVYVMGNHEHYNFDIAKTEETLKCQLSIWPNVHLLEKETWEHQGITFVGGTLWTDMNKEDSLTMYHVNRSMNDFQCVTNSNRKVSRKVPLYAKDAENNYIKDEKGYMIIESYKFKEENSTWSTEDAVADHKKMLDYINIVTQDKAKSYVAVTHHMPTQKSIAPWYANDTLMNGGFASDLSEFIMDRPQIKLWTCGHTHHSHRYYMGETLVVNNARGYAKYEQCAKEFQLKYIDLDNMPTVETAEDDYYWKKV